MTKIRITDLEPPRIYRSALDVNEPPDTTLINLNLMLVNNDGTFDQQVYIPLGLLYIAGYIRQFGMNSELIDYQLFNHAKYFDAEAFVTTIGQTAPVIGISCMSNLLPFAIQCADLLKRRKPDATIVLGGVGPSPVALQILEAFAFVDCVVEGEGELVMHDIVQTCRKPSMSSRRSRLGKPSTKIAQNLDSLPLPAYELIDFDRYDAAPSIITSRGCPYSCTFCTEPYNFSGSVRFRGVESVIRELEEVHDRSGRTLFLFQDDILPLKPSRFHALLDGIDRLSFPIEWKCFSRVDLMDDELMLRMARSGCIQVRYGIESGSNKTLARIKKGFTIEEAFSVAARSLDFFPSVHASFIWGYPFEEVKEFEETLYWVEKFEEAGISVLLFEYSPLPGSPLYQEFQQNLTFSNERYSFYVVSGHETVKPGRYEIAERMTSTYQLIADHPRIFSGFYHYRNFTHLQFRQRLEHFNTTRRTPVRNEQDL